MTSRSAGITRADRPALVRVYIGIAHLVTVLVLLQAFLGGRRFAAEGVPALHEIIANVVFLLAVALVALAFIAGLPAALKPILLGLGVAALVLTVAQIGMGYAGRENLEVLAWHVPNGVLLFGVAVANSVMAFRIGR